MKKRKDNLWKLLTILACGIGGINLVLWYVMSVELSGISHTLSVVLVLITQLIQQTAPWGT